MDKQKWENSPVRMLYSKENRDGVEKRDLGNCFVMNHYNSCETSIKTGDT